jgi:hypothetical protein
MIRDRIDNVNAGERWRDEGYDLTSSNWKEGLIAGRFGKMGLDAANQPQLQMLDGTATPVLAGVILRNITDPVEPNATIERSQEVDYRRVGGVTVDALDATAPAMFAALYANNVAGDDAGKLTATSGASTVDTNAEFIRVVKAGVWLIRLK